MKKKKCVNIRLQCNGNNTAAEYRSAIDYLKYYYTTINYLFFLCIFEHTIIEFILILKRFNLKSKLFGKGSFETDNTYESYFPKRVF